MLVRILSTQVVYVFTVHQVDQSFSVPLHFNANRAGCRKECCCEQKITSTIVLYFSCINPGMYDRVCLVPDRPAADDIAGRRADNLSGHGDYMPTSADAVPDRPDGLSGRRDRMSAG